MRSGGNSFNFFPIINCQINTFSVVCKPTCAYVLSEELGGWTPVSPLVTQPFNGKENCRKWEAM